MTLSDILNGYGNKYDKQAFVCIRSEYKSNPYLWPRQNRPGANIIRLWKKAICTCFPRDRYNNTLYTLGKWICDTDIDYWTWFFFPGPNLLYKKSMEDGMYLKEGQEQDRLEIILVSNITIEP